MDEAGNVQLTGACLPRFAKLPFDTERIDTGDFVYLAPEVLRGDKYEVFADIYSFGLFILELAQVEMPVVFREQRKMTLCDFIRTVDPEKMLNLEEVVEVFTNNTRALILNCLEIDKDNRPLMSEVIEYTSFIKNEKDALAKLPTRRSRARPIKRPSLDKEKELKGKYESSTYL
jgi:serine/threonine protein kinase